MTTGQIFAKTISPARNPVKYISTELLNLSSGTCNVLFRDCFKLSKIASRFTKYESFIEIMQAHLKALPNRLKNESVTCIKTWTRQCECVSAQQVRRAQQMFCLYSKLWEEHALKEFFKVMRQRILKRSKEFLIGAVGVSVYDWNAAAISDAEIMSHSKDFDYAISLKNQHEHLDGWEPYIDKKDLLVWRRVNKLGLYEYKVYGKYNDVTALDFLRVQIDTDYRKQWDKTAKQLKVIESEINTNSDIVYWEMQWPVSL